MGLQFNAAKLGDRYFYSHYGQTGSFTPGRWQTRKQTQSAEVCCGFAYYLNFLAKTFAASLIICASSLSIQTN